MSVLVQLLKPVQINITQFTDAYASECDISVSKLLGFETFPFFLMLSVSVSKIFGIKKKYRYWFRKNFGIEKSINNGFGKFWYQKKVLVSVSKHFGIEKSIGIAFEKFWYQKSISIGFKIFWH